MPTLVRTKRQQKTTVFFLSDVTDGSWLKKHVHTYRTGNVVFTVQKMGALNKWYLCFHNIPFMPLWTFLGRNVTSSNLFLWENTVFFMLRFPKNNCDSRRAMPLLCSHAIHPYSHQILEGLFLTSLALLFSQNHYLI